MSDEKMIIEKNGKKCGICGKPMTGEDHVYDEGMETEGKCCDACYIEILERDYESLTNRCNDVSKYMRWWGELLTYINCVPNITQAIADSIYEGKRFEDESEFMTKVREAAIEAIVSSSNVDMLDAENVLNYLRWAIGR